ncbi:MAG: PilN domain-containing protein [Deltaproteobacteria bacterium]|nr:PilN domain-containing protein [Deltaproteobacteria bacterium]
MIKINLLQVKAEKKKQTGQQQVILFALILAVEIVILGILFGSVSAAKKSLVQKVAYYNSEIQKLDQIIGEVNQYKEIQTTLKAKLNVIEELKKGRSGPIKVLDELAQKTPKKLWLIKFEEKGRNAVIVGEASSDEDIAVFLADLERSKYFTQVRLKFTKAAEREGNVVKQFEIECVVNYAI